MKAVPQRLNLAFGETSQGKTLGFKVSLNNGNPLFNGNFYYWVMIIALQ